MTVGCRPPGSALPQGRVVIEDRAQNPARGRRRRRHGPPVALRLVPTSQALGRSASICGRLIVSCRSSRLGSFACSSPLRGRPRLRRRFGFAAFGFGAGFSRASIAVASREMCSTRWPSIVRAISVSCRRQARRLCCKLGEGAMRDQGASCSPYDSALARRSCSHAMASVRAHGPRPKARSTIRASPTMPPWRANIPAWPLRSARITSKPLIVA